MERDRGGNISRRTVLRIGAGLFVAGGLAVAENDRAVMVGKIIATAVSHPQKALETASLFLSPQETYRHSPLLETSIRYSASETDINIVAFGDSNMGGVRGREGAASAIELFTQKARQKFGLHSKDFNFSKGGATTGKVIDDQILSRTARRVFENSDFCDVWISAGGNNLGTVLHSKDDFSEAERAATDPEAIVKYGSRIVRSLSRFEGDFLSLLTVLNNQYGDKIRNLIIMSIPDVSKAQKITSPKIDDKLSTLSLDSPFLQRLAYNIAVEMNNSMFRAAELFQEEIPGIRVIGIDTFPQSDFAHDQHLTAKAFDGIANEAVERIEIDA